MISTKTKKLAFMPESHDSPAALLAEKGREQSFVTAQIEKPINISSKSENHNVVEVKSDNEFIFRPQSYFPTKSNFPYNGNASWNGSEIFSRPRINKFVRDKGFHHIDLLIVEHFHLIPLIRAFQAKQLIVIISSANFPDAKSPKVINQRWKEVAEDADVLLMEDSIAKEIHLRSQPPRILLFDQDKHHWADQIFDKLLEV